jgi:hypothetical protein
MPTDLRSYDEVNRKWKSTCQLLLGGEIGDLKEYEGWLSGFKRPSKVRKSDASGREAVFGVIPYYDGSRWLSFEDVKFEKKYGPVDLNKAKDIDSLIEAVSERIYYTGSVVLGNSNNVEKSSYVIDSFFVYRSEQVFESKYIAYTTHCIYSECNFGCQCSSVAFGIRSNNYVSQRLVETSKVDYSSDVYFSHGLSNCQDCMFSFNMKNKRHCIGNLQLSPDKYFSIKGKLLAEMREELVKNKRLPSLIDLASGEKPDFAGIRKAAGSVKAARAEKPSEAQAEKAFAETAKLIFGKPRGPTSRFSKWLSRDAALFESGKSCASGKPLIVPDYGPFFGFPRDRLISQEEEDAADGMLAVSHQDAETLSLESAGRAMRGIAFFCPEWNVGNNAGNVDCPTSIDSSGCLRCVINIRSKNSAYDFWPRNSEAIFGSYACGIGSSFCIKCYFSKSLARCFETDASRNCTDLLFCHNCENVHDSMFCFNVKNLRYAIGNAELPKEKYMAVKRMVLAELNSMLEKEGGVRYRVFSLLEKGKK